MSRLVALAALLALSACASTDAPDDASPPPSEAAALLEEGNLAFRARDYAGATELFLRAIDTAEAQGDESALTEACALAANGHFVRDLLEAGAPYLARAEARATPEDPRGWSRFLLVRGRYERQTGDLAAARTTFVEAYDYCTERALHDRAVDAAHMVALVAEPEEQIEWGRRGIAAAEAAGEEGWLGPLWNNLGWTLDGLERHEEALDALRRAREFHLRFSGDQGKLIADWSVGVQLRKTGDLDAAEDLMGATLAWARRRHDDAPDGSTHEWLGWCLSETAELRMDRGQDLAAAPLFGQAIDHLREAGIADWGPDLLTDLEARHAAALGRDPSDG